MQSQLKCLDGSQGPQKPGSKIFRKKPPVFFLKFFGPATPLWVLEPSVIMHLVSTELLLASAVFARSIIVLGCQPGAPQIREHDFLKKNPVFFKFIEPLTPLWVLQPSRIMHLVFTEVVLARAVLHSQLKCLVGSQGPQNPGSTVYRKKNVLVF